jgi:hypothetical protein
VSVAARQYRVASCSPRDRLLGRPLLPGVSEDAAVYLRCGAWGSSPPFDDDLVLFASLLFVEAITNEVLVIALPECAWRKQISGSSYDWLARRQRHGTA